ncbi:MAG: peptidase S8, partial [Deltaproteobacteria bacterium]|nr:peptidase S8 [Deltaproteobacteria bacterium]
VSAGAKGPEEVEKALFAGADHKKSGEWNDRFGHGVLDAKGALDALGGGATPRAPWWKKILLFVWALVLWLISRLSLPLPVRRAATPGMGFFVGLVLATLGLFFLPWLGLGSVPALKALATPMPDWVLAGSRATSLFYSALIPIVFAFLGFRRKGLQGAIAGLAVGFAAALLVKAFSGSATLAWLPFASWLSIPWLILNVIVLLLLARAALKAMAEPK